MIELQWHNEQRKVNDLLPLEINPRTITAERKLKLVESLGKFNLVDLPVINLDEKLISGHQRCASLQLMGRGEEIIEVRVPNRLLTEKEVKEYNILANTHAGEFNVDMLLESFGDIDLSGLGLDLPELDLGLGVVDHPEATEDNYEIPEKIVTDIVPGDYFEIGPHRLLCGDSTLVENWKRLCKDKKLDANHTDPPYNVAYTGGTKEALTIMNDKQSQSDFYGFLLAFYSAAGEFTRPGAPWYIWHADSEGHNFRQAFLNTGNKLAQTLIWKKNSIVMGRQDYQWMHEPCLYGWKLGAAHKWYSDRTQTTILEFDKPVRNAQHPTMKPVPLVAYLLCNSTKAGQIIGDGFGGSGTTMVAAHQTHRICFMQELDPKYCQVIIDRMKMLDPSLVITRNGNPY